MQTIPVCHKFFFFLSLLSAEVVKAFLAVQAQIPVAAGEFSAGTAVLLQAVVLSSAVVAALVEQLAAAFLAEVAAQQLLAVDYLVVERRLLVATPVREYLVVSLED